MCIREDGPALRDARVDGTIYLDGFVYPEAMLETLEPGLLRVLGGKVIKEREGYGTRLLARLKALRDRGPKPMPEDERKAVSIWSSKMLERFRGQRNIEADYRRTQLLYQSLEDYFALRNAWYEGPKASFRWLREHDERTYRRFERAAGRDGDDAAFEELVKAVYS